MLSTQSVKDLTSVRDEGVTIVTQTTPKTGVTYERPVLDEDTIEFLSTECMISLCNRMLAIDYRNNANRPSSKADANRLFVKELKADDTKTDAQKFTALADMYK